MLVTLVYSEIGCRLSPPIYDAEFVLLTPNSKIFFHACFCPWKREGKISKAKLWLFGESREGATVGGQEEHFPGLKAC